MSLENGFFLRNTYQLHLWARRSNSFGNARRRRGLRSERHGGVSPSEKGVFPLEGQLLRLACGWVPTPGWDSPWVTWGSPLVLDGLVLQIGLLWPETVYTAQTSLRTVCTYFSLRGRVSACVQGSSSEHIKELQTSRLGGSCQALGIFIKLDSTTIKKMRQTLNRTRDLYLRDTE